MLGKNKREKEGGTQVGKTVIKKKKAVGKREYNGERRIEMYRKQGRNGKGESYIEREREETCETCSKRSCRFKVGSKGWKPKRKEKVVEKSEICRETQL